jgi:DivIVA domain-containing protein
MTDQAGVDLVPGMQTVATDATPNPPSDPADPVASSPYPPHFDVVLRGYDRRQVDDHLARIGVEQTQLRSELERDRPSFDALGHRVSQMLELAEAEAAQMRAQAAEEAARVREEALREAEELGAAARRDLAALHEQRRTVLAQLATIRDTINTALEVVPDVWPSDASATIDVTGERPAGFPPQ